MRSNQSYANTLNGLIGFDREQRDPYSDPLIFLNPNGSQFGSPYSMDRKWIIINLMDCFKYIFYWSIL